MSPDAAPDDLVAGFAGASGADLPPDARDIPDEPSQLDDEAGAAVVSGMLRAPWMWERLIVESAVIGGDPARWKRRLSGLAKQYERLIRAEESEDPESPRLARLRRDEDDLRHLAAFALPVIDMLASWPQQATWGEWLDRFNTFAPRVLMNPVRVLRVLGELRAMAAIGPVTLEEVRDVLSVRLRALDEHPAASRYGRVFVGSPHQARGRTFRVVFVPGLAERLFPQKPREDPMLLDREMREPLDAGLVRAGGSREDGASAAAARRRRCHRASLALVSEARCRRSAAARAVVLCAGRHARDHRPHSQPRGAAASCCGRGRREARLAGAGQTGRGDRRCRARPVDAAGADRSAGSGGGARTRALSACVSTRRCADRSPRGGRADDRAGCRRTAWCGSPDSIKPLLDTQRLGARPYSVSALQKFSTCPYQFLLSAIYRLEPNEEPEPLQRLDPLMRGALFHEVQAEFLRAMKAEGRLPVTDDHVPHALTRRRSGARERGREARRRARAGDRSRLARRDRRHRPRPAGLGPAPAGVGRLDAGLLRVQLRPAARRGARSDTACPSRS